jgi:hypothetical protein
MTVDTTVCHKNGTLPVLDLNMWMSTDREGKQVVNHSFYKKEVASKYTILKRSAMSMSIKRTTHFQEVIRRLKNCDRNQCWMERAFHLSEWGNMLRISGYNELYRFNILRGAVSRYDELIRMEKEGLIANLYRNRAQVVSDTVKKGGKAAAATWFMRGGKSCTLNTAPTPDGLLRDRIQSTLTGVTTPDGAGVKVVETGGVPVSLGLKKTDPFRVIGCDFNDPKCIVEGKTSSGTMGSCYQLLCSCGDMVPDNNSTLPQNQHVTQRGG